MATPANWEQFQEDMGRWQAAADDLARRYEQLIDVATNGQLGALAYSPDLSSAPMGSLGEMQQRLQVQNVAGLATVGQGPGLLREGAFGLGSGRSLENVDLNEITSDGNFFAYINDGSTNKPASSGGGLIVTGRNSLNSMLFMNRVGNVMAFRSQPTNNAPYGEWARTWHTANTTRDANGGLRSASPIFRVATNAGAALSTNIGPKDGLPEREALAGEFVEAGAGAANKKAAGVTCKHLETGVYVISGSLGFARDNEWPNPFIVPEDPNGNRLVFAEADMDESGAITLRTYAPTIDENGRYAGSEPMDIPSGRWIDFRLEMPAPPSDEYPDEEPALELTPEEQEQQRLEQLERWRQNATITPRQARLVLSRRGLLKQVDEAVAGIEDEGQREVVEIEWEYAVQIDRASAWVNTMYAALGLAQEDVDELFREAAQI